MTHRNDHRRDAPLIALACLLIASPASAVIIDWTLGNEPTDAGYPSNFPVIDNTAGTWTSTGGGFHGFNLPDLLSPTAQYLHGYADVQANAFSTIPADVIVARMARKPAGDAEYFFDVNILEGEMAIRHGSGAGSGYGNLAPTLVGVFNTDGDVHRYGWELDRGSGEPFVRLFFDGQLVGDPLGYNVSFGTADGSEHGFGDATGGEVHEDIWHRYVVAEGQIPEPTTALLLAIGCLVAAGRRRR